MSGKTTSALGRIKQLRLGFYEIDSVLTTFPYSGYSTSGDRHGMLGVEILKRFKVIFDYERDRMILEPSVNIYDPFLPNMSGLKLSRYADT